MLIILFRQYKHTMILLEANNRIIEVRYSEEWYYVIVQLFSDYCINTQNTLSEIVGGINKVTIPSGLNGAFPQRKGKKMMN